MSPLQIVAFFVAVPALLVAAYLVVVVVLEEVRSWFRPGDDLMRSVWRDPHGRYERRTK